MNAKSSQWLHLQPAKLIGAFGLGASLTFTAYADASTTPDPSEHPLAVTESNSAAAFLWENTVANLNLSVDTTLYGYALSALGLGDGNPDYSAQMLSELQQISSQLTQIDATITQLDNDVKLENCNLDEATAVSGAVSHIRSVTRDYNTLLMDGGNATDIQNWLDEVFNPANDQSNSISQNLVTINTGLMPAGSPDTGVLASCINAMAKPTAGQLDDTSYYQTVQNLTNYFYAVQAEGMAVVAEAYDYKAYQAWVAANPNVSLDPTQASSICANASGEVLSDCKKANTEAQDVYMDLQDEFTLAGAPYSTSQYKILNGSNYLFVLSLEDFTSAAGVSCSSPLTTTNHCGPTAGNHNTSSFTVNGQPVKYGPYYSSQWQPMNTSGMQALFGNWTGGTLSSYLSGLGFQNTANKIILTDQVTEITVRDNNENFEVGQGTCFADTRIDRSEGLQPFCSNIGSTLLAKTGVEGPCAYVYNSSWTPSGSSDGNFYPAKYGIGYNYIYGNSSGCGRGFYGAQPGYMSNATQLLWPQIDVSSLPCTTNADTSTRQHTNPAGVPTMCGTDFDAWFQTIVAKPPTAPQGAEGLDAIARQHQSRISASASSAEGTGGLSD